jgi:tRNA pseudouridine synthase 10
MLGGGRPFLVELVNPRVVASRVTPDLVARAAAHRHRGAGAVAVSGLRLVPRAYAARMRDCEVEKRKRYRCVVWTARPVDAAAVRRVLEAGNGDGGVLLKQSTPLRVLHRRTLLVRERRVFETTVVRFINRQAFVMDIVTQAGTYVKEFVHGDNGRTTPSVMEMLGCDADILQLDVAGVEFRDDDGDG